MDTVDAQIDRPGLLVSVRNVDEARIALEAGVDVIDVKEPARGSLGAADSTVVMQVADLANGRVPVSVAVGELLEDRRTALGLSAMTYAKLGLAGCDLQASWRERWGEEVASWPANVQPVAVAYADWRVAAAPRPEQVLEAAAAMGIVVLLVDTWEKSRGDLFDHWSEHAVAEFGRKVRATGMRFVLAGSLCIERFALAVQCGPDLVAVRGAVCEGGRTGRVSATRIQAVRQALRREARSRGDKPLSSTLESRVGVAAESSRQ